MPRFIIPFGYETVWDYNEFRSDERPTHNGIDFGPGRGISGGEGIAACGDGTVLFAGWGGEWGNSPGFGNVAVVDHGDRIWTIYAHMVSTPKVKTGQKVTQRQTLGHVGDTGNARGEHLHLEVWVDETPINPRDLVKFNGGSNKVPPSNEREDSDMLFFNVVGKKGVREAGLFLAYPRNDNKNLIAKRLTRGTTSPLAVTLDDQALEEFKGIMPISGL